MVSNNFQESKKVGTFSPKMNNWRENPLQYYFNKNKISYLFKIEQKHFWISGSLKTSRNTKNLRKIVDCITKIQNKIISIKIFTK